MHLLSAHAGHWTGHGTGVTVVLPPPGTVASGEIRGGAPATREFALLEPGRLVDRVDAVVLSGGSAFGLAAGDGVMAELRAAGRGFGTPHGPVPIVVGMALFDASVADPAARAPGADAGRRAVRAALAGEPFATGAVGAGAGAATGTWRGRRDPGGVGVARGSAGPASVVALAVVNAWGDVLGPDGRPLVAPAEPGPSSGHVAPGEPGPSPAPLFGHVAPGASGPAPASGPSPAAPFGLGNTTLAVLLTDARLSKADCHLVAQSGHSGFARALHPAHSRYDGDAVVAMATGEAAADADLDLLRAVAATVTADAIRAAVSAGS